ncbi:MAG: prolyl oligopeptidase family serine peptidase [Rhodopirellula sp.]|nr:prolyl oligopeptidase family serine peptidase [Rhodopirellula sp.]
MPTAFEAERSHRKPARTTRIVVGLLAVWLLCSSSLPAQESPEPFVRRTIPDGIEYGLWNRTDSAPAPVLFVLAGTIESTLGKPYFRQCGNELAEHGWVCVTIDLPCHGTQAVEGQPTGLSGWSDLATRKRDFVAESNARLTRVLDHLIESGVADPERIAACGTSRGGFLAIHFAAHDKRVKCAAGFAPVTDLAALSEFRAIVDDPFVATLSLESRIEQLTGRPVWIVIGDQDERVGTDRANVFAQKLTAASRAKKQDSRVELNILPEPRGHSTPPGSSKRAANWILRQFPKSGDRDVRRQLASRFSDN